MVRSVLRVSIAAALAWLVLVPTAAGQSATSAPAAPPPGDIPAITSAITAASAPAPVTAPIPAATGGVVVAGSVAFSFPSGAFAGVTGDVTVSVTTTLPSTVDISGLAGNVLASKNGTVLDLTVRDSGGNQITSFATPITVVAKPNPADLAMANGNFNQLTVVYFVAPNTPSVFNPLGLPVGTALFQPNVVRDPASGTMSWFQQNGAGIVQAVVANPVSYVQTLTPSAPQFSSFDPATSQTFGTKPQFSYLEVAAPQIPGVNRLVVLDPDTGNYSYVNATQVAPSGPPPARSSAAVVRGLLDR